MANGGLCSTNVFRKHITKNAQRSKYSDIIKTREEVDAEEAEAKRLKELKKQQEAAEAESSDDNVLMDAEPISVDELTSMADKLKIRQKTKGEKKRERELAAQQPQITIKSKGQKKDNPFKKSKK